MPRPRTSGGSSTNGTAASSLPEPSTYSDGLPLPKLIVFDLDYTLWPFWVDTHVSPPLKAADSAGSKVKDRYGEGFGFYDDVPAVLGGLKRLGIPVAAASRTDTPDLARQMLKLLRFPASATGTGSSEKSIDFFNYLQIYPGSKTRHFNRLHVETGIPYEEMLFFDDESRNRDTESLGVTMWLVRDGVTRHEVDEGVKSWRKKNKKVRDTQSNGEL